MSERFELIGEQADTSGHLRLAYGTGPDDPMLFVLTLTPQYVARAMEKPPPVTFQEIERYAYDHAGDLRTVASREKDSERLSLVPEWRVTPPSADRGGPREPDQLERAGAGHQRRAVARRSCVTVAVVLDRE
jgi:hypothetical protein